MVNNFRGTRLAIFVVSAFKCFVDGNTIICNSTDSCDGVNEPTCNSDGTLCTIHCTGDNSCTVASISCASNADCIVDCTGIVACQQSNIFCPPWPYKCEVVCQNADSCYGSQILTLNDDPKGALKVDCDDQAACGSCNCRTTCTSSEYICEDDTCTSDFSTCLPAGVPQITSVPTILPTAQPTVLPTSQPTPVPTTPPSPQPTTPPTPLPTTPPSPQPTAPPTPQPTPQPTTPPTPQPSAQPTLQPTAQPTLQPTVPPTVQPTPQPTTPPTPLPTALPTPQPTAPPTPQPTAQPTPQPTTRPTPQPTTQPSAMPTPDITLAPTAFPTPVGTDSPYPSPNPSALPTFLPTIVPSAQPTVPPTPTATVPPTLAPTLPPTISPTTAPSPLPTFSPTQLPTLLPIPSPTLLPIPSPTISPTPYPTLSPVPLPTTSPSLSPTFSPVPSLTLQPTLAPTTQPTIQPTTQPSTQPTSSPSIVPTPQLTPQPTVESISPESPVSDISGTLFQDCFEDGGDLVIRIGDSFGKNSGFDPDADGCEIDLHDDMYQQTQGHSSCSLGTDEGEIIIAGLAYDENGLKACFVEPEGDNRIVSQVVEIQLGGNSSTNVIVFTMPHEEVDGTMLCMSCVWYDHDNQTWSDTGCETVSTNEKETTCKCTHLTAFAVLQQASKVCAIDRIVGNPLWLVFMILYIILFLCSLYQLVQVLYVTGCSASIKLAEHFLICAIAICQIAISATFFFTKDVTPSLPYITFVWALAYSFTFIAYLLVVSAWAKIVELNKRMISMRWGQTKWRRLVAVTCAIIMIVVLVMFAILLASPDGDADWAVVAGSAVLSSLCIMIGVSFLIYGYRLIVMIAESSHASGSDLNEQLIRRLYIVACVISTCVIVQSLIPIISAAERNTFFDHFTALQSFYLALDILALFTILFLFYEVVRSEAQSKKTRGTETSHMSYSENSRTIPNNERTERQSGAAMRTSPGRPYQGSTDTRGNSYVQNSYVQNQPVAGGYSNQHTAPNDGGYGQRVSPQNTGNYGQPSTPRSAGVYGQQATGEYNYQHSTQNTADYQQQYGSGLNTEDFNSTHQSSVQMSTYPQNV